MDWDSFLAFGCRRGPGSGRQPIVDVVLLSYQASTPWPGAKTSSSPATPLFEASSSDPVVLHLKGLRARPEVARQLRSLLEGRVAVGFDLDSSLAEIGLAPTSAAHWIDLSELGSLLLPGMASPSEPALRQALGVPAVTGETATSQARTAAAVFERLLGVIGQLDLDTLLHVNRLAAPLAWPFLPLFREAERRQTRRVLSSSWQAAPTGLASLLVAPSGASNRRRQSLQASSTRHDVQLEELVAMLGQAGAFGQRLPDFEERPEQQAMVRAIGEAFNQGGVLLVEAGTGTGKSLAYLLPAAYFAVSNNRRVVVSTNTINLQDQLFQKDVPAIRDATGLDLQTTVLKGRTNYLCLRRWFALLRAEDLEPHERSLLIKTLLWVSRTVTGDKAELRLVGREEEAWSRVCAVAETCTPLHCQFHRAGICFVARARRAAEESHLVIVNHALLLADSVASSKVLPDFDHVIVDEAHHLEAEATSQFGWHVGQRELAARLRLLLDTSASAQSGLLPEVLRLFRHAPQGKQRASSVERMRQLEPALAETIARAQEGLDGLLRTLQQLISEHGQRAEGQVSLRLSAAVRAQPRWSDVELAWDEAAARFQRLEGLLSAVLQGCEEVVSGAFEEWEELVAELTAQHTYWSETRQKLATIFVEAPADLVAWLSVSRHEDLWLNAAPLHVGPLLHQSLFRSKEAVMLTSATLSTGGHFRYVKERLGLEDAREMLLGSPFDYRQAALVYLPSDMPEPSQPGYQERVQAAIQALATTLGGRCLVLFTSYAQLRATHQALAAPLEEAGIRLLAQGQDGASRAALLEAFRADQQTVLLGTNSFWEGVDVVGEALSCLVIPRLPFSVPSDPVFEARSEAFDDPFNQYAVPQAILRFKQGFRRLIRSRRDRGALVLLDRRVETKFYGRVFLRSLPGGTVRRGPLAAVARTVESWLAEAPRRQRVPSPPIDVGAR